MRPVGFVPFTVISSLTASVLPSRAVAQTPRVHIEPLVQVSRFSLYAGDATVGAIGQTGLTARVAVRGAGSRLAVEPYYSISPKDDDPYHRAPRLDLFGTARTYALLSPDSAWSVPLLRWGFGGQRVDAQEPPPCFPPCFAEGGPSFRDGWAPALMYGIGVRMKMTGPVLLRADLDRHRALASRRAGSDTRRSRTVLSLGLGVRL